MPDAFLSIRSLVRRFGDRVVLDGVDLDLVAGQRLAIQGRSGRGKTTLLRLIAGLEEADDGSMQLGGRSAMQDGRQQLAPWEREVQLVFQDLGLWPTRTVAQHLGDTLRAQGVRGADAQTRATPVLERLGLRELAQRRPARLSGGEARRVALARALVARPRLLLLDEPFASLDRESREEGFALLDTVLEETEAAVILVTHDADEAARLGGDQLELNAHGKLS